MPDNLLSKISYEDIVDVKQQSLYARLKRLFATDVIVRNIGGKKIKTDSDELQYATDRNSLRDRFNRVRSTAYNAYTRDFALSYQAARLDLFRDYDTMDMDPILSSALDIYADECVAGETLIPLLDGSKHEIQNLYKTKATNFWVYSIDNIGNFTPQLCERVAYNGKKKMFKITLDDGTEIKCTSNHVWVKSNNLTITTDKLMVGDSLKILKTKLSTNKFINGYEMILDGDNKWKYTHRVVANSVDKLITEKNTLNSHEKVIHHSSFNKLNNSPDYLQWVDYKQHRLIHSEFNKQLWNDTSKTHEYKLKTIEGHRKYWTSEARCEKSNQQKKFMVDYINSLSPNERKCIYGRCGDKNGMFKQGYKITSDKNGRWKGFSNIESIDINKYESDIISGLTATELRKKYNLNATHAKELNASICKKHNIHRIYQLKRKLELDNLYSNVSIPMIRFYGENELKSGNNILRNLSPISEKFNITNEQLFDYIQNNGYKGIKDLMESNNHRILSIEELDGEFDAYDLVNVGNTTHLYAIECKDGSKLITHNCLTENEMGEILTIDSKNNNIKDVLHNLFYDILNVEFNLWSWIRNTCKYGDTYLKLNISPEYGVYLVEPMSAYNVERIENSDPLNKNYVKFQIRPVDTSQAETLEAFQVAHFRLLSDSNFLPYGKSMLEPARRVWKQLSLLEDAMLIHRIMRAPEKRIFKIDIGNIPPNEVDNFMEKTISKLKKVPYVDERTGDYNLRFNLQNQCEDFYLPVRGSDSGASIENLPGLEFTGIDDLEYVKNKMMAALKIPKAFLGYEEGISGKATLAAEDVRFARTIGRLQKMMISELNKIARVHLYSQGYRDASLMDFTIGLTNPSTIFEKEKMEIWSSKLDNAKAMWEMGDSSGPFFNRKFIYKKIFKMSDDDIQNNEQGIVDDCKQLWRMKQITEDGNDPASPFKKINPSGGEGEGEGGGGGGPEVGGPEAGGPEAGGPEAGGPEAGPEAGGGGGGGPEVGGLTEESTITEKHGEPGPNYERPSQAGQKKSSDYPFGEDALGGDENDRKKNSARGVSKSDFKTKLPTYENVGKSDFIKSLDSFLTASKEVKKDLIKESVGNSLLDEKNIIE